jgi:hypothetical protein
MLAALIIGCIAIGGAAGSSLVLALRVWDLRRG